MSTRLVPSGALSDQQTMKFFGWCIEMNEDETTREDEDRQHRGGGKK